MKYINAEKLKVEIERRIAAYQKNFDKADNKIAKLSIDGRIASLKGILPFITSLQQEQPEVDLEIFGAIARHVIAVKEHVEDMRFDEEEWLTLEKIGYPERFKSQKQE